MVADVWEEDVWDFQAKSGSSGSRRLFLCLLGKVAVPEMSGKAPWKSQTSFFQTSTVFWFLLIFLPCMSEGFRDRKGTPKNFCDKDFAELSGELSGAICLETLALMGNDR